MWNPRRIWLFVSMSQCSKTNLRSFIRCGRDCLKCEKYNDCYKYDGDCSNPLARDCAKECPDCMGCWCVVRVWCESIIWRVVIVSKGDKINPDDKTCADCKDCEDCCVFSKCQVVSNAAADAFVKQQVLQLKKQGKIQVGIPTPLMMHTHISVAVLFARKLWPSCGNIKRARKWRRTITITSSVTRTPTQKSSRFRRCSTSYRAMHWNLSKLTSANVQLRIVIIIIIKS